MRSPSGQRDLLLESEEPRQEQCQLGHSQNHLAVAGGCAANAQSSNWRAALAPTRYREVVLTVSKFKAKARENKMLSRASCELIPATSYSPTQFPAQYHRLQQA